MAKNHEAGGDPLPSRLGSSERIQDEIWQKKVGELKRLYGHMPSMAKEITHFMKFSATI